jgi:hypothetical protein
MRRLLIPIWNYCEKDFWGIIKELFANFVAKRARGWVANPNLR